MLTHVVGGTYPKSFLYQLNVSYDAYTFKPTLIQNSTTWPSLLVSVSDFPNTYMKNWPADYNGDGKTDFITWNMNMVHWVNAYSDGKLPPTYTNRPPTPVTSSSALYSLPALPTFNTDNSWHTGDFNGDGLSDFLYLHRATNPASSDYTIYFSTGSEFISQSGTAINFDPDGLKICVGDFNGDGQTDLLSVVGIPKVLSFQANNKSLSVLSIEHAGKTLNVDYKNLTQDADYYRAPYISDIYLTKKIMPLKVVKALYDNVFLSNHYYYEGLVFHKYGLGLRGFNRFITQNTAGQRTFQTFELATHIPYLKEEQLFDAYNGFPFGKKTTYQQINLDGGAYGQSRIIVPFADLTVDYINAQKIETAITTGLTTSPSVFYDFGGIASTDVIIKDLNGNKNSRELTTYDYGSNWVIDKGKVSKVTVYNDIDINGDNSITRATKYTYNSLGGIETLTTDPATINSKTTSYDYDLFGNIKQESVIANNLTPFTSKVIDYTIDGKFVKNVTDAENYMRKYGYGNLNASWGNVLSDTNIQGFVTDYEYDAINRVTKEIDHTHKETINNTDFLTTFITYTSATSSPFISGLSNARYITTRTNNDNSSYSIQITDKYSRVIRNVHSDFSGTVAADVYDEVFYSNIGLVEKIVSPHNSALIPAGVETEIYYDPYNREIDRFSSHGGPNIHTDYSISSGLLNTTVTNVNTNKIKTTVTCGNTLKEVNSTNENIIYSYYGNGITYKTVVNGDIFTNRLDDFGRIKQTQQPNAGNTYFEYNSLGQIVKEIIPTSVGTGSVEYQYTYDKIGRITQKLESGTSTPYTYVYHPSTGVSNLYTGFEGLLEIETVPDANSTLSPRPTFSTKYIYNNLTGQLIRKEEKSCFPTIFNFSNNTNKTFYDYFPNGKLKEYRFHKDISVWYHYYSAGGVCSLTVSGPTGLNAHTLWIATGRSPRGELTSAYYFNQNNDPLYHINRGFDPHGHPININLDRILSLFPLTPVVDNTYDYNPLNGNLNSRTDHIKNPGFGYKELFTYDTDFDRLTNVSFQNLPATSPTPDVEIEYAKNGNILKKSDVSTNADPSGTYTYPWKYNQYQLLTVPYPASPQLPFLPFEIPDKEQNTEYFTFNKIKKISEDLKNEVLFTYGPGDERIKTVYNDISTPGGAPLLIQTKHYGENFELIEHSNGNFTELYYIWAGDDLVSIIKGETLGTNLSSTTYNIYYPIRDQLGSITHIMDDEGLTNNGLIEERSYDAWGRVRDPNTWLPYFNTNFPTSWITDRGYTGHEHIRLGSWNNNIINMNGRLYDPLVGRMFSPDPFIPDLLNSQDYNKYSYARNNPLKYVDPDGEWIVPAIIAFGGFINLGTKLYQGKIHNFQDGLMAFSIGSIATAVGVYTGGFAFTAAGGGALGAGGFYAGAYGAMTGTAISAPVLSTGNTSYFGDPPMTNGEYLMTVGISGLTGGAFNGVIAKANGSSFWNGSPIIKPTVSPVVDNTRHFKDVETTVTRKVSNTETQGDYDQAHELWKNVRIQYEQGKSNMSVFEDKNCIDHFEIIKSDKSVVSARFYYGGKENPNGWNIKIEIFNELNGKLIVGPHQYYRVRPLQLK